MHYGTRERTTVTEEFKKLGIHSNIHPDVARLANMMKELLERSTTRNLDPETLQQLKLIATALNLAKDLTNPGIRPDNRRPFAEIAITQMCDYLGVKPGEIQHLFMNAEIPDRYFSPLLLSMT